jgi:hypothetical protein
MPWGRLLITLASWQGCSTGELQNRRVGPGSLGDRRPTNVNVGRIWWAGARGTRLSHPTFVRQLDFAILLGCPTGFLEGLIQLSYHCQHAIGKKSRKLLLFACSDFVKKCVFKANCMDKDCPPRHVEVRLAGKRSNGRFFVCARKMRALRAVLVGKRFDSRYSLGKDTLPCSCCRAVKAKLLFFPSST